MRLLAVGPDPPFKLTHCQGALLMDISRVIEQLRRYCAELGWATPAWAGSEARIASVIAMINQPCAAA